MGQVSRLLVAILTHALSSAPPHNPKITVERPQHDPHTGTTIFPRINLFLYEVEIDGAMRNIPLTPGAQPPLWLVLRYLLTAFDGNGDSDTPDSHDLMGQGMQTLMGAADALTAVSPYNGLTDNPQPLKLTFDQATPELLSKLMQGPDDKYRCSAAFQVRPVLIARPLPVTGLQLVGINYRLGTVIGLKGVRRFVLPSLGPQLEGLQPAAVQLGDTLKLLGENLDEPGITVNFGPAQLTPNEQHAQSLSVIVQGLDPTQISAGNLPASIAQQLANGLSLSSQTVGVSLLPTVLAMAITAISAVSPANPNVYATIAITGNLLGAPGDYVEFALVQNGVAVLLLDSPDPAFAPPPDQTRQQFAIPATSAVPPGIYYAILRVNGQQSKQAFALNMVI